MKSTVSFEKLRQQLRTPKNVLDQLREEDEEIFEALNPAPRPQAQPDAVYEEMRRKLAEQTAYIQQLETQLKQMSMTTTSKLNQHETTLNEVQPYIQDIKRVALSWDGKKSRTLDVLQGYCGEGPLNEGIPASKYGLLVDICTGGRVPRHEVKSIMEELGYEQKRWGKNMCYMGLRFAHPEINACENTKEALKEALMSIRRVRSANLNGLYNPGAVPSASPSSAASSPMSAPGTPVNSTISSQKPVISLGKN